jgi:hypothetical protein
VQERLEVIGEELIIHLQATKAMRKLAIKKEKINHHILAMLSKKFKRDRHTQTLVRARHWRTPAFELWSTSVVCIIRVHVHCSSLHLFSLLQHFRRP